MKLIVLLSLFASSVSFAQTKVFEGNLAPSETYPMLDTRKCRIDLEVSAPRGEEFIAFKATPRIKDVSPFFAKDKAPVEMRVNDYILTTGDVNVSGDDFVLSGQKGNKKLYVFFNEKFEITSWSYIDGDKTPSGFTFNCIKY